MSEQFSLLGLLILLGKLRNPTMRQIQIVTDQWWFNIPTSMQDAIVKHDIPRLLAKLK